MIYKEGLEGESLAVGLISAPHSFLCCLTNSDSPLCASIQHAPPEHLPHWIIKGYCLFLILSEQEGPQGSDVHLLAI